MMNFILKAREVLKHIVPWDEQELDIALQKDYKTLKADKKAYAMKEGFTLKNVEESIYEILKQEPNKAHYKQAKIIVDEAYSVVVDLYFYFEEEERWEKSTIEFNNTIVLSEEDDLKLQDAPPLEYDFV